MIKDKIKNKIFLITAVFLLLGASGFCLAHLPRIVYTQQGDIKVQNPENSQAFYDELNGSPRNFLVSSDFEFTLYINLLVPDPENHYGRYSVNVFQVKNNKDEKIAFVDGQTNFEWQEFYEEFGRDYYLKGPEFEKILPAGDYKIEIFSYENKGKYVLAVGKKEVFPVLESAKVYLILPMLKMQFFKTSVLEFLFTPFGIVGIGIIGIVLLFFIFLSFMGSAINKFLKRKPRMMLLTSSGMQGSKEDILAILPKPPEDILVAHIITATKPEQDKFYAQEDERLMKEAGFNVEQIDIEGKNYSQLLHLLGGFDIVYVQGGNAFYLLKCMRACNFKKVMKKLFRQGIIYVGVSAGSIAMGKNIQTAKWLGDSYPQEKFGIFNFAGLKFVGFDIFVHYTPEYAEIIKKQSKRIKKKLKILQDGQAIFVLGKKITFVGTGEVISPINL